LCLIGHSERRIRGGMHRKGCARTGKSRLLAPAAPILDRIVQHRTSPHWLTAAAVVALAAMVAGEALWDMAAAADLGVPPPDFVAPTPSAIFLDPNRFELRGGAFAHGVGSIEEGTVDVNLEFVTPRIPIGVGEWWSIFLPRFHIGGMLNTSSRTSYA